MDLLHQVFKMILENLTKREKKTFYDSLYLLELTPVMASLTSFAANGAIEHANFFHQYPELSDKILNGSMAATLAGGAVLTGYFSLACMAEGATVAKYLKKAMFD